MKKIVLWGLSLVFMILPVFSQVSADTYHPDDISFGNPVNFGPPLTTVQLTKGNVTKQDGKWVAVTACQGNPSKLQVVDLETGTLIQAYEIPNCSSMCWQMITLENGEVYFGSYVRCRLYSYSPETKTVTDYGSIAGEGAAISMCLDDQQNIYIGTFPTSKIVKFDTKTKKMTDYGRQLTTANYLDGLSYYKNALYYCARDLTVDEICRYDLSTGTVTKIPVPSTIKAPGYMHVREHYLMCVSTAKDGSSVLILYDLEKQEWTDILTAGIAQSRHFTPETDGVVYFIKDGYYYGIRLETLEIFKTDIAYGSILRGSDQYMVEISDPDFPGPNYVNFQFNGGISICNFQTQKMKTYTDMMEGSASVLVNMRFAPNGKLYVGEYMGVKALEWDIMKNQKRYFHMAQAESFAFIGNKGVFGNYTAGTLYILDTDKPYDAVRDTSKPLSEQNPIVRGSIGEEQDRIRNMIAADGKAIMGSFPDYYRLGGALSIYDPETDQLDVYRNVVQDQSVLALAYADGKIYGGTSVSGGLGIDATQKEAKVFVFDMETRKVLKEAVVQIPGTQNPTRAICGLYVASDGTLVGSSYNAFFKMDPNTLELLDYKVFDAGYQYGETGQRIWEASPMNYDEKTGLIFMTPMNHNLMVLDPLTLEYRDTKQKTKFCSVMGPDGNIYSYDDDYNMVKYPVIRGNDKSYLLSGKIVLKLGENQALINGVKTPIDQNPNVAPFLEKDHLMVPLRFFSESMGMNVLWNDVEQFALLYNDHKAIKLKAGSRLIDANGSVIEAPVPVMEENDRLFVPLRAMTKISDVSLHWENSGLLLFNQDGTDFDGDEEVLDYAEEQFHNQ